MNYQIIAPRGLKIRSGPGLNYEEAAEPVAYGEILIGADLICPDPAWLPILLEDDSVGYVARKHTQTVSGNGREIEEVEISPVASLPAGQFLDQRDLIAKFGYPKNRAGYLTTIDLREFAGHLAHVRDFTGRLWSFRIYGHELLAGPLKRAFQAICDRGLAGELKTFDGCFCIRKMTSRKSYSVHSWGLAVDFNARQNPYGGEVTFSDDLILCFAETGFEAGALWDTPDGMHFQRPWTHDWRESDHPLRPQL